MLHELVKSRPKNSTKLRYMSQALEQVTGRRKQAIESTADLVTRAGGTGVPLLCDHGVDEEVQAVFDQRLQQQSGFGVSHVS